MKFCKGSSPLSNLIKALASSISKSVCAVVDGASEEEAETQASMSSHSRPKRESRIPEDGGTQTRENQKTAPVV